MAAREMRPRIDWSTDEHRSKLFDVCHDPEESYKRILALETIADLLAKRIDVLEKENSGLKEHIRNCEAEAVTA